MGGKIIPSSVLVIQNGTSKLINIKDQDSITKILDMVPDLIDKFTKKGKNKETDTHENDDLDEKIEETMKCQSKVTHYEN